MIWLLIISFVDAFLDWTWISGENWNDPDRKFSIPKQPYESWYYFGFYKPDHREWFPFSTTIFVWLTDWYHFAKMCRLLALILLANLPIWYIAIYAVFSHYTYMMLSKRKL